MVILSFYFVCGCRPAACLECCKHAEQILGSGKFVNFEKKCLSLENGLRVCAMCVYRIIFVFENNCNKTYLTLEV